MGFYQYFMGWPGSLDDWLYGYAVSHTHIGSHTHSSYTCANFEHIITNSIGFQRSSPYTYCHTDTNFSPGHL